MLYCKRRPSGASVWLLSSTDATPSDYGANTATAARTSTYVARATPNPVRSAPLSPRICSVLPSICSTKQEPQPMT